VTSNGLDVVAIGDAIVDVIATCDDAFLDQHRLPKGSMQLLSAHQADALYAAMGPAREISGGSAANSMAGTARGRAADWPVPDPGDARRPANDEHLSGGEPRADAVGAR
jgi:hypothetical protein